MNPSISLLRAVLVLASTAAVAAGARAQSFVINTADIPSGAPFNASDTENVDFGDVDGDGDFDAVFADGGEDTMDRNRLWLNNGPGVGLGTFTDVTGLALPDVNDSSRDVEFADIDGDSDLDLFIANHSSIVNQPSRWWVNATGTGVYTDETQARWVGLGGPGSSISSALVLPNGGFIDWSGDGDFADLDNDGDLDLFHSSYGGAYGGNVPSRVFLNDGAGYFSEFNPSGFQLTGSNITNGNPGIWSQGIQQSNTTNSSGSFCDVASSAADVDLGDTDGDLDIDILHGAISQLPRLFQNRLEEDGGVLGFRDVTAAVFPSDYATGSGHYEQEMGDLDGDGDLDIFGLNWHAGGFGFTDVTLENTGAGTFANTTELPGSESDDEEGDFIDFDNDGDLDLFLANFSGQDRLYANTNNGGTGFSFLNVTGDQLPNLTGVAKDGDACDVDCDGDYDIFVAQSFNAANVYLENVSQVPDQIGPYIPILEQVPNQVPSATPTVVRAQVYDNAPYYITWYNPTTLNYSLGGGPTQSVAMKSSGGQIFRGEIPGILSGTVTYWVTSTDKYGNSGTSTVLGYESSPSGEIGTAFCFGDGSGAACPCGNTGASGAGCANGTTAGATLHADGTTSVAIANFSLSASGQVPLKPGVFFQGVTTPGGGSGVAWGDGLLCAGGSLIRLETVISDAAGSSMTSVDIVQQGAVSAGLTRVYQHVYRDPQGTPCGGGFNSTGAIQIVWLP